MKGGCLNVSSPIAAAGAAGKGQIYCKIWQKLQFLADAKAHKIYFPPIQKFNNVKVNIISTLHSCNCKMLMEQIFTVSH